MYFIRLAPLKLQLKTSDLPQRVAFQYLLASAVLFAVLYNPEFLKNDLSAVWNWFTVLLSVALTALGTWLVYRANGGAEGRDFLARFIALGWVVGIRLTLALLLPMFLLGFLLAPHLQGRGGAPMLADLVATLLSMFLFYWRLSVHVRDVATSPRADLPTDSDSADGRLT